VPGQTSAGMGGGMLKIAVAGTTTLFARADEVIE
jgi:hypothetical protein